MQIRLSEQRCSYNSVRSLWVDTRALRVLACESELARVEEFGVPRQLNKCRTVHGAHVATQRRRP